MSAADLKVAVKRRRLDLGYTQEKAAQVADVSVAEWRVVEKGTREKFRALTLGKMSIALGWPTSRLADILDGSVTVEDADDLGNVGVVATALISIADSLKVIAAALTRPED